MYSLNVKQLNKIHLRSSNADVLGKHADDDEDNESSIIDFLVEDSFIAVAAGSTVWFMKVIDNDCLSDGICVDDYGNAVGQGVRYLKGQFLEKIDEEDDHKLYKLFKKTNFTKKVLFTHMPIFKRQRKALP